MSEDYPAAHSMDTTWFAVDAAGHVGLFNTGENGHAPAGEENDVQSELWNLYLIPEEQEAGDWWNPRELCALAGVYYFDYDEEYDPIGPYDRSVVPGSPLHIDQLPPDLRQRMAQVRFEKVRFSETRYIQPIEHVACESWESAYLDVNCQRIRPIPGKEADYAAHFHQYSADPDFPAEPPPEDA
jgi:hypothetical protein